MKSPYSLDKNEAPLGQGLGFGVWGLGEKIASTPLHPTPHTLRKAHTLHPTRSVFNELVNIYDLCPEDEDSCLDYLSEKAISKRSASQCASSLIIDSLQQKIERIDKQVSYLEEKINYYRSRNWTHYITLDPIKLVQNLFGGGEVQKTQLTITDLETKIDELKDNQNQYENQLIIEQEEIKNEVATILIDIEKQARIIKLIKQKKEKVNNQYQVFLVRYSSGEGTTNEYLNYGESLDRLDFELLEAINNYQQNLSKLMLLIN